MSNLFTYVVRYDTGLAPNPFWGVCTLAVCAANHQGSKAYEGDWIAGFLESRYDHRFLYAMEVGKRIDMDAYFKDERFQEKKPIVDGTPMQKCGDNFYSLDAHGKWQQHWNLYHRSQKFKVRDIKHHVVWVSKRFWYLGSQANPLPEQFRPLAGGRGTRRNHPDELVKQFKRWVMENFREDTVTAMPRDFGRPGCGPNPSLNGPDDD